MARRVNKRFLIVFGSVLIVGLAGAFVLAMQIRGSQRKEQAKKQEEQADRLVAEADKDESSVSRREKLTQAAINLELATATDGRNAGLNIKLGDVYSKMTAFEPGLVQKSRQRWAAALEVDPAHATALRRLMESFYQEVQLRPLAAAFGQVEERASAIHKIDPKDKRAHALMFIAPIHQWLANIETPAVKLDKAIEGINELIAANPTDPEAADWVFWAAQAVAKKGVEARRGNQDQIANDSFKAATQMFDEALSKQEQNAWMHYRYFEVLAVIRRDDQERDNTQRYTERMKREVERARELAKGDDENYVKIMIGAHEWALSLRDLARAEQILVDAQNAKPKDQRVRLALARLWRYNKEKRATAIDLLRLPIEESGGFEGVEALRRRQLEADTLVDLTTMLIDDMVATEAATPGTPAGRETKLKEIEAYHARAIDRAGESSQVLKLRGKIELLRGGNDAQVKAIKSFERAQAQYRFERNGREETELMFLLARAYLRAGLTGQAKTQLVKFMEKNRDSVPVRMMLAQILVREGDLLTAKGHVDWLEKQAPEEPDIVRLAISVMDPIKDKERVAQYVGKLPERTRAEQIGKAQVAMSPPSNNLDEAVRLYKQVLEKDPADFEPLNALKDVLVAQGKKAEAVAVLKAAKATKADDKIDLLIQQLEGATPEEVAKGGREIIRKMNADDPLVMNLKLYEFEMMAARAVSKDEAGAKVARAEAFKYLQEAERIKGDDVRVMDQMFTHCLQGQEWDKAAGYAERLGAANADQVGGLIYRFRLAMVKGDFDKAIEHATGMTQKYSEFARSWVFLAQALQSKGRLEDAVSRYGDALERQSENPDALAGIIACLYQLSRAPDAIKYINQGVNSYPNNPWFREQKKAWEMSFGDPALVLGQAKSERDAKPDDAGRWVQLARVQLAAARKRDANQAKYVADAKQTLTEATRKWPAERVMWALLVDVAELTRDFAYGEGVLKEMGARPEFKDSPDAQLAMADFQLRFGKAAEAEATLKAAVA
ncbi:MAG TPA: tetratricopeptide repeat protein, partial [Tepidisphaeraceae bacterium]|nr:tetratricopeptide repeat protein [Tepidisphaeraceae bacterium]